MIRKHFYLTEEQEKFLQEIDGLTVSEHLRRAIDDYIIKMKIQHSKASYSPSRSKIKVFYQGKEINEQSI